MSLVQVITIAASLVALTLTAAEPPIRFEKHQLTERYYCDGVAAADIDRDGHVDVVAGPFWFAGPEFTRAHEFYAAAPQPPERSPSNSMYSFVHDFSGDGWPDILVLGRVHLHPAQWYENPGESLRKKPDQPWPQHFAFERIRGESPALVDLDGDGRPQLICHWDNRWGWVEPDWDQPHKPWRFHAIGDAGMPDGEEWPQFYHGEGVGDLNGDGRLDLLLNHGWYEQRAPGIEILGIPALPPEIDPGTWWFHAGAFSTDRGGAQMFADDVDSDGDADVITALNAHGYGLAWFERLNGCDAAALAPTSDELITVGHDRFRRHLLMSDRSEEATYGVCFSQPHALESADLNGDGHRDIIVGKRMWAHGPTGDIEPEAAPVLYWFEHARSEAGAITFKPHRIDDHSGVGVQITVADLNADGRPDLLTASKLGVFVFLNRGSKE